MALAILELLDFDRATVRYRIDTGTNRYYQLKVGRAVERRQGIDWVDDLIVATDMSVNEAGGGLFNSSKEISIPAPRFDGGKAYAQLFSFKTADGRSPAFSNVVRVPLGVPLPPGDPADFAPALSFSRSTSMNTTQSFKAPRRIPCKTYGDIYARQASLEDLLSGLIKLAAPTVASLLGGAQNGSGSQGGAGANASQADLLAQLLKTVLGSLQGAGGVALGKQQSLAGSASGGNRFFGDGDQHFSRPFIFGIDDALLGTMIGPLVQMLPQLMNSVNQQRVQMKQADNKLVTDILSEVNRRMILDRLTQSQRESQADANQAKSGDLKQLIELLEGLPPDSLKQLAPALAPALTPAVTKSLSLDSPPPSTLSSRAVVSFVTAEPVAWNGSRKVLFARGQEVKLSVRLSVAEPAPKTPLPKALLRFVFKDGANQSVLFEKSFKQKDVQANSALAFTFSREEISRLPANKNISVLAEMRWLNPKSGKEYKALGSSEIVLIDKYFLKEQGGRVSPEKELTDMKRFRPFWNKVWESPSLSKGGGDDSEKKYLWELNVGTKYSVLLSAEHETNGLMATKVLRGEVDEESLSEKTEGRMKAGVELSVAEMNKLLPLWEGEPVLDRDKLESFMSDEFVRNNAAEFVYNLKLKGRGGERGMVWVAPVFQLFECTLSAVSQTDGAGQVIALSEEKVRFPLPVAARVIGLKSHE